MDLQADAIDRVIKNAIQVMENSKYQMFEIMDATRDELKTLNEELKSVLKETGGNNRESRSIGAELPPFPDPAD